MNWNEWKANTRKIHICCTTAITCDLLPDGLYVEVRKPSCNIEAHVVLVSKKVRNIVQRCKDYTAPNSMPAEYV